MWWYTKQLLKACCRAPFSCKNIYSGELCRSQALFKDLDVTLLFVTSNYKAAHKEWPVFHKINKMCLYAFRRFRKCQQQNINKSCGYFEYIWMIFKYFLSPLHQMLINITRRRGKRILKELLERGKIFAEKFFYIYSFPTSFLGRGGGRGHLRAQF